MRDFGLTDYDASQIVAVKAMAEYFDAAAKNAKDAKGVANWMLGDVSAYLNSENISIEQFPVSPDHLAELVNLLKDDVINSKAGKQVFAEMVRGKGSPEALVKSLGLEQVSDAGAIEALVDAVLEANPQSVADFKAGKDKAIGFLTGQVMKQSKGKANPPMVQQILREKMK